MSGYVIQKHYFLFFYANSKRVCNCINFKSGFEIREFETLEASTLFTYLEENVPNIKINYESNYLEPDSI